MAMGGNFDGTGQRRLRRAMMAVLLMTSSVATVGLAAPAQAQEAARNFDIPAQPLADALTAFGQQSGLQVSARAPLVEGRTSHAVQGTLSPMQALSQLLAGTGLSFRMVGSTVTLELAPQASWGTIQLGPVRVEAVGTAGSGGSGYIAPQTTQEVAIGELASITANGLVLTQRETPQSTSVVTRQQIDDRRMTTLRDVMENATGITVNQTETDRFSFYSRGFEIDSYQYDGVPVTLDSTYQYGDGTMDTVLYDRMEIVRGATGLMIGAGEPGASINLIRKRPKQSFEGYASGLVGSYENRRAEIDITGPLTGSGAVRARLVGALQSRGDTVDFYKQDRNVLFGVMEADIGPSTMITIGANRQKTDTTGTTWAGMPAFDSEGQLIDWPKGSTTGTHWTGWDTKVFEAYVNGEHYFANGWKLRLSYNRLENDFTAPLLYIGGNPDSVTGAGTVPQATKYVGNRDQDSVAFTLNGDFAALGHQHQFVIGAFGSRSTGYIVERTAAGTMPDIPDIFAWDGSYPEPQWSSDPSNERDTLTKQLGIYGTVRLAVNDRAALIGGARLNYWKGRLTSYWDNYDYSHSGIVTPYAGLTYDLTDTLTLYGSYTTIYKPQTYQDIDRNYLAPARGRNYEVGIKGSFFDDRLIASAALFRTKQKNVAEYVDYDVVENRSIYRSIEGTTTDGVEFEVLGQPAEGWNVSLGFTYRDAEDNEGNAVNTFQPKTTLKFGTNWRTDPIDRDLTIGGNLRWQSKTHNLGYWLDTSQSIEQPSYAVVDLMARYQIREGLDIQINAYNIFDKRYYRTMGFYNSVFYGDARTVTAAIVTRF